jgi:DNA polymerase-1
MRLRREILQAKSGRVVLLGKVAKEAFMSEEAPRGVWVPFGDKLLMPTWHPAYVLRKPNEATPFLRDIGKAVAHDITVGWTMPEVRVVETPEQLKQQLSIFPERVDVAFDGEMDNVHWHPGESWGAADAVLALTMAWTPKYGIVMDDQMLYDCPATIPILQEFFDNPDRRFITQNGKFDDIFFAEALGLRTRNDFDVMLAHYTLDENSRHGLKELSSDYLGAPDYEGEFVSRYLKSKNDFYSKVPTAELLKYAVCDSTNTLQLAHIFEDELKRNNQFEWPFSNILMPASKAFESIERRGMKIDLEHLNKWHDRAQERMDTLLAQAQEISGRGALNLNSTQQVAVVLYDDLGLPMSTDRKIKQRSTAHDAVEHLRGRHPFVNVLMAYRKVAKMQSSYIDNLLECYDPRTGRVHVTALLHGTEIGRLSMRDPALQTIPRAADNDIWGAAIRSSFIAELGRLLGISDFSQAELRAFACLSEEPFLYRVYREGRDLHDEVAVAMFGPNFTHEQRVMCKMFNFSYLYGGNEHSFANDAGLDLATAVQFVRSYDANMPVGKKWKQDQLQLLRDQGYVESIFHRRRRFPLITQSNVDEARKSCVHAQVAGTASDLTLLSLIKAENAGMNPVLTVHDSILNENDESIAKEVTLEISKIMAETATTYLPDVPWVVGTDVDKRWELEPEWVPEEVSE